MRVGSHCSPVAALEVCSEQLSERHVIRSSITCRPLDFACTCFNIRGPYSEALTHKVSKTSRDFRSFKTVDDAHGRCVDTYRQRGKSAVRANQALRY